MKTLIVDVYRFIYRFTGAKFFSTAIAVIYVTVLNMVMLYGLGVLMAGWVPTGFIVKLFVFPYIAFTFIGVLLITLRFKPGKKAIAKEAKKTKDYTFIMVYSAAALVLFLYVKYGSRIIFENKKLNVKPRKRPTYTQSQHVSLPEGWCAILIHHNNKEQKTEAHITKAI